ncbi:hypothetical protein [Neobacillus sp. DY30]|uniref:hypothetical protein n=1 Tax=Neobacillus sp. DY30 TaxID=3047871 RepID=UPI0024BF3BE6|nr:hypothetical protein [Neobacillus sp. DY30]WHY01348.1 hypothetical protein QNH29_03595 [Neobacillus sp. DY30]
MSNKRVKSVSFNITNPQEKEFLERLEKEKIEFSGYVKELILADVQRRNAPLKIVKRNESGGIKIVVGNTSSH